MSDFPRLVQAHLAHVQQTRYDLSEQLGQAQLIARNFDWLGLRDYCIFKVCRWGRLPSGDLAGQYLLTRGSKPQTIFNDSCC